MLVVGIIGWILFNRTPFGRRVQAIGSNRQAALFSGIRISRTRIMVMTLMGFIVGIAAVVALAFNRNGSPTVGVGTELGVIAATIIGGTALSGGSGSVLGAILGALIIALDPEWAGSAGGAPGLVDRRHRHRDHRRRDPRLPHQAPLLAARSRMALVSLTGKGGGNGKRWLDDLTSDMRLTAARQRQATTGST